MGGGVAVLIASKWQEELTEVKRVSKIIMLVWIRVGKRVLCLVSVYAPQAGRAMVDKEEFYESLGEVLKEMKEGEALFICGDFNGHVGGEADGYEVVHGMVSKEETLRVSYCWYLRRSEIWLWQTPGARSTKKLGKF